MWTKIALQLTFWGKLGGLMWTGEFFFGGVFFGPKFRLSEIRSAVNFLGQIRWTNVDWAQVGSKIRFAVNFLGQIRWTNVD